MGSIRGRKVAVVVGEGGEGRRTSGRREIG
jgi:hypothetical protein